MRGFRVLIYTNFEDSGCGTKQQDDNSNVLEVEIVRQIQLLSTSRSTRNRILFLRPIEDRHILLQNML